MRISITVILLIVSGILFAYTFFGRPGVMSNRDMDSNTSKGDVIFKSSIDENIKNKLFKNFAGKPVHFLAIFLIETNNCTGCQIETVEYLEMLNELDENFFSDRKIENILLFRKSDSIAVNRFKELYNVNERNIYYNTMTLSKTGDLLGMDIFEEQTQLILLDKSSNQLHRILLLNRITPLGHKEQMLSRVIFN